jgi:Resolvase, N terminal domain
MAVIGYARVSTQDQDFAGQIEKLKAAGAERIYSEKISGARSDRHQLAKLVASLKAGDVVTVCKLDRLGRSTTELFALLDRIDDGQRHQLRPQAEAGRISAGRGHQASVCRRDARRHCQELCRRHQHDQPTEGRPNVGSVEKLIFHLAADRGNHREENIVGEADHRTHLTGFVHIFARLKTEPSRNTQFFHYLSSGPQHVLVHHRDGDRQANDIGHTPMVASRLSEDEKDALDIIDTRVVRSA